MSSHHKLKNSKQQRNKKLLNFLLNEQYQFKKALKYRTSISVFKHFFFFLILYSQTKLEKHTFYLQILQKQRVDPFYSLDQ